MVTPKDLEVLEKTKVNLADLEKAIDKSLMEYHGDYPWEEAIIEGEYPESVMVAVLSKYKDAGWKYIHWAGSSESGERPGLTEIRMSTTLIDRHNLKYLYHSIDNVVIV